MSQRGPEVEIRRVKWPSEIDRVTRAFDLGRDDHGRWLHVPAGTDVGRSAGYEWASIHDAILLIPVAGWWAAYWNALGSVYVDIGFPVRNETKLVAFVDLDLDIVAGVDERVRVIDEHEFEERRVRGVYPDWVIRRARASVVQVLDLLEQQAEPFGTVGLNRLMSSARR